VNALNNKTHEVETHVTTNSQLKNDMENVNRKLRDQEGLGNSIMDKLKLSLKDKYE